MADLRSVLSVDRSSVDAINDFLLDPANTLVNELLEVVDRYGTPDEINRRAREARRLDNLLDRLDGSGSPYLKDIEWLMRRRDDGSFISIADFRGKVMGDDVIEIDEGRPVTLEISALQYFPWLITEARRAIERGEVMPARYIRVRRMREQESDGDLVATAAAVQVVGASYVETMDTKGTDGSNIHLGGPETLAGYFGGVGQPNDHAIRYIDEFLYYYTEYGIRQVLNLNPGTVLLGYLLHRLGVEMEFKISVYMGNDNPYSVLWTLMTARLFSREGRTPLVGFNMSNSVNLETLKRSADVRRAFGLEDKVRIEHHVTETWKGIVKQPYNRREELVAFARYAPNISAKHEGAEVEIECRRDYPSDIMDYFREKEEVLESDDMHHMEINYLDKHHSVNLTAEALTRAGLSFVAAWNLHPKD